MRDDYMISEIRKALPDMAARGFPTYACLVGELVKRFENLQACHKLLAEREERLTQEKVNLSHLLENAENWIKRNESGISLG